MSAAAAKKAVTRERHPPGGGGPAEQFFGTLRLHPGGARLDSKERLECPGCGARRKFYCYSCFSLVGVTRGDEIPLVRLPIKVKVVKHPQERAGKSTAIHARVLAPGEVSIHEFPALPEFADPSSVVLLFPAADAAPLSSIDPATIREVVFVDSTWFQCNAILADPRLQALRRVKISEVNTLFWRPQKNKPPTHLATIEAIYHFFRQYAEAFECSGEYDGRYDDLMFWFVYWHRLIHTGVAARDPAAGGARDAGGASALPMATE